MKLLAQYSSSFDAEEPSHLLEDNGIATFVSSKRSNKLGDIFTGAFTVGLWVVLDEQYQDACQLLVDPTHKVSNKLSVSEMMQIKSSVHTRDMGPVISLLFKLLAFAILFALGVNYFVRA